MTEQKHILGIPIDRFYVIAVILIVMWLGLMLFFYLKADEVTKDPCSVCARRLGNDVICYAQGNSPVIAKRIYYQNYSILTDVPN